MTPNTNLTPELLEQVKKLTPAEKDRLILWLEIEAEEADDAEDVKREWKDELARRIAAYDRGEVQAVDAFEDLEQLRQELIQRYGPNA